MSAREKQEGVRRGYKGSPPHPPKPCLSSMMALRRKITTLVRIENSGFAKTPDLKSYSETATLLAVLSGGRTIKHAVVVKYKRGERERILEALARGEGSEKEVAMMQAILERRSRAVQTGYGHLQRLYGNGAVS